MTKFINFNYSLFLHSSLSFSLIIIFLFLNYWYSIFKFLSLFCLQFLIPIISQFFFNIFIIFLFSIILLLSTLWNINIYIFHFFCKFCHQILIIKFSNFHHFLSSLLSSLFLNSLPFLYFYNSSLLTFLSFSSFSSN